ncbi:MAG: hypothetical protein KJ770_03755 [Actinobacteria bacterium]|nr:hypothetical protein [Actinomycetota bacterium]
MGERSDATRKISKDIEDSIMKELTIEKQLITDPEVPLRSYNYSYIKDSLLSIYGQKALEAARYNYKQVHSTTGEIPYYLFKRKIASKESLFREFTVPKLYVSTKDIFALRDERVVNAYRRISFNKLTINIP